jgi:hypothetical protein
MQINYKGSEKDLPWRLAEVSFRDDEWELACRMEKLFRIKGYDFEVVTDGYAAVQVEDYTEYQEFVEVYKEVKRCIKNCMKFGF